MNKHLRDVFFGHLYDHFKKGNKQKFIIMTNDFGAPSLDQIIKEFPKYYINSGICEQNIVTMSAGLAEEGFTPIVYSISSFLIYRAYEQIKLDISVHNSKVILLGVGTGYSYDVDGPTHHTTEDLSLMYNLKNINIYSPFNAETVKKTFKSCFKLTSPLWIRMDRGHHELKTKLIYNSGIYLGKYSDKNKKLIICTGTTTVKISEILNSSESETIDLLSIFKLKPLPLKKILDVISEYKSILVIEEHNEILGLFSILLTYFNNKIHKSIKISSMGINEKMIYNYNKKYFNLKKIGLNIEEILKRFN